MFTIPILYRCIPSPPVKVGLEVLTAGDFAPSAFCMLHNPAMDGYQEELDRPRLAPGYHSEANYTALDLRSRRALDTQLFRIVQVAAAKGFLHTPDIYP